MFAVTAVYALIMAANSDGTKKLRHRDIGLSSLVMAVFILAQVCFPLQPMFSIGLLLCVCILHTFVLENERGEYRDRLEAKLQDDILKGNYYDLLTGLPGMSHFFELIQDKRSAGSADDPMSVFLYLNLSGLKFYNQRHGFTAGDRLLRDLSKLLIAAFGAENCSRFGQDHFVVFAPADGLEDTLRGIFREWDAQNDGDCPAILVGVYPDVMAGVDVSTACDQAKIACDALRRTYVSSIKYFDSTMLDDAERRQYITTHLDEAMAKGWIQVYYQPIVRALSGRVCDEEALARWIDPTRGFLSPGEFIPILEDTKLIYRLDLYVVDQVIKKLQLLKESGLYMLPQSINLSRSDFDMCDIVEEIRSRVDDAGLPHNILTIEITESIIGSDFDFIKPRVERFRALGFPVWMDDFGSGYSSLDVLQSMPVDLIKFDMRFMQQFGSDERSRIILSELMKMAVALGIDTVCEGVEREDQVDFLRDIGCSKLQGFYFSKPIPLDEVLDRHRYGTRIGVENPAEAEYYDAIGRVNLYDLSAVASEDDDSLRNYFNTVPMALIEVQGDTARLTRTNQAYRDFIIQTLGSSSVVLNNSFVKTPTGPGHTFVVKLRECILSSNRAIFDDTMADGTLVHALVRRIADNPLNGMMAVAVVVLDIDYRGGNAKESGAES